MVGGVGREKRRLTVGNVFLSCVHERSSTTACRIVYARSRLHICYRSVGRKEGVGLGGVVYNQFGGETWGRAKGSLVHSIREVKSTGTF